MRSCQAIQLFLLRGSVNFVIDGAPALTFSISVTITHVRRRFRFDLERLVRSPSIGVRFSDREIMRKWSS
jgi:hypothetical protein